jgi:hypothetical protein
MSGVDLSALKIMVDNLADHVDAQMTYQKLAGLVLTMMALENCEDTERSVFALGFARMYVYYSTGRDDSGSDAEENAAYLLIMRHLVSMLVEKNKEGDGVGSKRLPEGRDTSGSYFVLDLHARLWLCALSELEVGCLKYVIATLYPGGVAFIPGNAKFMFASYATS